MDEAERRCLADDGNINCLSAGLRFDTPTLFKMSPKLSASRVYLERIFCSELMLPSVPSTCVIIVCPCGNDR